MNEEGTPGQRCGAREGPGAQEGQLHADSMPLVHSGESSCPQQTSGCDPGGWGGQRSKARTFGPGFVGHALRGRKRKEQEVSQTPLCSRGLGSSALRERGPPEPGREATGTPLVCA